MPETLLEGTPAGCDCWTQTFVPLCEAEKLDKYEKLFTVDENGREVGACGRSEMKINEKWNLEKKIGNKREKERLKEDFREKMEMNKRGDMVSDIDKVDDAE